ncbi:MAG TPA: alanine racemase, partial [bacterium]|nr:alanine racemase [bacterium]
MSNTWAEIDLDALKRNIEYIRRRVGEHVRIMAVVKDDGYGHGAREIAEALIPAGIRWYGVANTLEGVVLRSVDTSVSIMVLGPVFSEDIPDIFAYRLTPIIVDYETAEQLDREAARRKTRIGVHVKIDTGMGRIGVWHEDFRRFIKDVKRLKHVSVEGFLSHFPASDTDIGFSRAQISLFKQVVETADQEEIKDCLLHMANSAAIMKIPASYFDLVRPGIMMYGLLPSPTFGGKYDISPVLSLKTRVSFIKKIKKGMTVSYGRTYKAKKDTVIATLPVGYGDGYNRHLSSRGRVLIRGKYAPVVGRVTMDQTMVDVGRIPGVKVGDEVVLIGKQGKNSITAEEIAKLVGTI